MQDVVTIFSALGFSTGLAGVTRSEGEPPHSIGNEGRGLEQPRDRIRRMRCRRGSGQLMKGIADYTRWSTAKANELTCYGLEKRYSTVAKRDIPLGPKTPWEVTGSAMFLSLWRGATIGSRFERGRDVVSSSEELS